MPDLAPVLATKLDVLRNNEMPGARLFLLKEGTTAARRYAPIEFDPAKPLGQVMRGWRVNPRRFDRFGDPFRQVQVVVSRINTAAKLATVAAFCVVERGEASAYIHKCIPAGQAELTTEPIWRFTSAGKVQQTYGDVDELLLADGVSFFLLTDGESKLKLNG